MPYVDTESKMRIGPEQVFRNKTSENPSDILYISEVKTAGELNYAITSLLIGYIENKGYLSYALINDCLGACYGAAQEFYRRVAVPYENKKIAENGDVYDYNPNGVQPT